jgi:Tfp pilus assembly protein PilV
MRKHRLAECLLVDVIGLEWEDVHAEACRWEHVMSEPSSAASSSSSTTRPSRRTATRSPASTSSVRDVVVTFGPVP